MIKITNLDKRYNKNKANEIHVINNISLELPSKGLVALLGPSGSGKSTLLNAIGGLDKVDKGSIQIEDVTIEKYHSTQWDHLRNKHIGYIFQNYILLQDLTVYENLHFALLLTGIEKELIPDRIAYALSAVKMEKFAKRKAKNLSGGQQQRVAIARALSKSPDIIIADEPTGNLDAQNSTQIMNIIKHISKECLVILVTHNVQLASFYANRIIQLKDGQIVDDYENASKEALDLKDDHNLYLGEYKQEKVNLANLDVSYFYKDEAIKPEISIIVEDNTVYVYHNTNQYKVKVLTPKDEIKVVEGNRVLLERESIEEMDYSLPKITSTKSSYHSVVSIKESFKMAFKKLQGMRKIQKLFLGSFALAAILIVVSIANILGTLRIDYEGILSEDKNAISVTYKTSTSDSLMGGILSTLEEFKSADGFEYFLFDNSIKSNTSIVADLYMQTSSMQVAMQGAMVYDDVLAASDLLIGTLPTKEDEVVVDRWLIEKYLENYELLQAGFTKSDNFIGRTLRILNHYSVTIVGIVDTGSPTIYLSKDMHLDIQARVNSTFLDENVEQYITTYSEPLGTDEILIHTLLYSPGMNEYSVNGVTYTIVGTFTTQGEFRDYVMNQATLERKQMAEDIRSRNLKIYSSDKEATLAALQSYDDFEILDMWEATIAREQAQNAINVISQLVATLVILLASLVFLYFIIRSSMIERIYEIGAYRSLGVTKRDIYKMFASEIFIVTIFSSFIGWLGVSVVMLRQKDTLLLSGLHYPIHVAILVLIGIFIINIVIGLLPVRKLLSQTPAQIMSKYDI